MIEKVADRQYGREKGAKREAKAFGSKAKATRLDKRKQMKQN